MHVHLDFETRSEADLKKVGGDVYAAHPSTEPLCLGFAFDDGPVEMWTLGDPAPVDLFIAIDDEKTEFIAHNAPFELSIWNNICAPRYKWPALPVERTHCTMALCYSMGLPGSLENAAPALGISQRKDLAGSRVMLQLCKPRAYAPDGKAIWWTDKEKYEKLYAYCSTDVEVERELHKRLLGLSAAEREMWLLDYRINRRGIQCDVEAINVAIEIVKAEQDKLNADMRRVTGNQVAMCTANGQLTQWLNFRGVATDSVDKASVADLLATELPLDVRIALTLRQEAAKSSTAKLEAMKSRASVDGRIRGTTQYHAASTGRWGGRGVQVQNFPRPSLSQNEIENIFNLIGITNPCS